MITFTVPGPPHGKGRPRASLRGGHVRMYSDPKTVAYEDRVCFYASQACGVPWTVLNGPVAVEIVAWRKRPGKPGPKHECRAGIEVDGRMLCTAKPDADNIAKAVLDGCTGVVVPPHDAGAIAGALARLAGDAGMRRAPGSSWTTPSSLPPCSAPSSSGPTGWCTRRPST